MSSSDIKSLCAQNRQIPLLLLNSPASKSLCCLPSRSIRRTGFHIIPFWLPVGKIILQSDFEDHNHSGYNHGPGNGRKRLRLVKWKLHIQAASCLSTYGFNILGTLAFGNWHYNFYPCRLRQDNSPIFEACHRRDVDTVRTLLERGEASPFDIDDRGDTPLHICFVPVSPPLLFFPLILFLCFVLLAAGITLKIKCSMQPSLRLPKYVSFYWNVERHAMS